MIKGNLTKLFALATVVGFLPPLLFAALPNDPSTSGNTNSSPAERQSGYVLNAQSIRSLTLSLDRRNGTPERIIVSPFVNPGNANPAGDREDFTDESSSFQTYWKPALYTAGALTITAVLIHTDEQTYKSIYNWKQSNLAIRDISPVITNFGDGRASSALFGGFLAYSYFGNDRTAFEAGKVGLESFLVSGIVTQILKHTFGRERPSVASVSGGRWNGSFLLLNQSSTKTGSYSHFDAFPSGHTATAFAAATTLAEVYHGTPWVSYTAYSLAGGVAISRVMEQTHWLSDCFVGGLIGYFGTQLVLHLNHSERPVAIFPVMDGEQMGLALNVGF